MHPISSASSASPRCAGVGRSAEVPTGSFLSQWLLRRAALAPEAPGATADAYLGTTPVEQRSSRLDARANGVIIHGSR
jgi:hypothetical protein